MLEVVFERTFSSFWIDEFVHLLVVPVFLSVPTGVEQRVPKLLLFGGDILSKESVLRSLDDSESLADTKELFLDFDNDVLLLELFKLFPSLLLFLQDCAEWGLPGESPLLLRVPGAGLCLPRNSPHLKIYTLLLECKAKKNMWMCYVIVKTKTNFLFYKNTCYDKEMLWFLKLSDKFSKYFTVILTDLRK